MIGNIEAWEELKKIYAEKTTPILVWIGAGLSIDAGMPSWAKLQNELLALLRKRASEVGGGASPVVSKLRAAEAATGNPWRCFQLIKEGLGPLEYEASIRRLIAPGSVKQLPDTYRLLHELAPTAVLNLNIDGLATRALSDDRDLVEFCGKDVADFFHVLKGRRFVANLHGDIERVSSWVFTEADLKVLTEQAEYRQFIASCLTQYCCVFLGISPADGAVGGHLERLSEIAPSVGPHFWLTHFDTFELDVWAQKARLRTIRYPTSAGDHSQLLQMLKELVDYRSKDEPSPPVVPTGLPVSASGASLPEPDVLDREPAESIRLRLNAKAMELLHGGQPADYEKFFEFARHYESPIYRAWHVSVSPPHNVMLGFSLQDLAGSGAFGSVYRATSPTGEDVAVKILHQNARSKEEMLQSFRRGVRAMQILTDAGVSGISRFRASSEIPAMVVMDWIDGPSLKDVVQGGHLLRSVESRLKIAQQLVEIVMAAHKLPARVLHRDIRPTNIILKNFWDDHEISVVVLDFDLSWHKDAHELSIVQGYSTSGYLAPEQTDSLRKISTRSSLVDSFGLGMTIFFIFSGRDPSPGEPLQKNWLETLRSLAGDWSTGSWKSFGRRLSRVIEHLTGHDQAERWDLSKTEAELERLVTASSAPSSLDDSGMIAEELMTRAFSFDYECVRVGESFRRESVAGTILVLEGTPDSSQISLTITWIDSGAHSHQRVKRWLRPALVSAAQMLRADGWVDVATRDSAQEIEVSAQIGIGSAKGAIDKFSGSIQRVVDHMSFRE